MEVAHNPRYSGGS